MSDSIPFQIHFRTASPTDIPACAEIEQDSYPENEAASKSALQYRQHHAAPYFRCAVLLEKGEHEHEQQEIVVGYICSTRCREFSHESMATHDTSGPLLAIHSVVVSHKYRGHGIAMTMVKDYIAAIREMNNKKSAAAGIDKLVLMAKSNLLGFYVQCGFIVQRVSDIVHGQDLWYHCELELKTEKQGYPYWVVDSFAEQGGNGNPAAVVLLPSDFDCEVQREWMKIVANEFHLSETAFIWPSEHAVSVEEEEKDEKDKEASLGANSDNEQENGGQQAGGEVVPFVIRYFTPNGTEVDLCGHATLASAAVLFQTRNMKNNATIMFTAKKDVLSVSLERKTCWRRPDADADTSTTPIKLKMDFPKKNLCEIVTGDQDHSCVIEMLKAAFGVDFPAKDILYIGLDENGCDVLVELSRDYFLQIGYDNIHYAALMEWNGYSRGVILCCREECCNNNNNDEQQDQEEEADCSNGAPVAAVDFRSRFFGPKAGIMEDFVTGSAHCTLGPYFGAKLNKTTLIGKQTSKRGGLVTCILQEESRVSIIGTAVTSMSGCLHIPTCSK
jgi:predicted PhzF superfamily epimerase YddE/YHI9/predicted GNAT family acetyltransferase